MTIKVKDDGNGNLVADGTELIQTVQVTNTYESSGEGEIKVQKVLNGREWTNDDEFTFTISGADADTPMPGTTSITITKDDADQIKSFGKITFTEAGEYTYTVKETEGTAGGVTYDTTEHTVTIKVVDDGNGKLVADGTELIQTVQVTNTYESSGEGEIKVRKVLKGRAWTSSDSFTFTIKALDGAPMPSQTRITITRSDSDQTKSFGTIVFTEPGTYVYSVSEVRGGDPYIKYDTKEYKITIEVVDDTHGKLVAKEGTQLIQIVTIKNTYSETPPTGDSRHLFLYASLMITSMMGLCMLYLSYRRKKRKE